jgi:S-layer homology domain
MPTTTGTPPTATSTPVLTSTVTPTACSIQFTDVLPGSTFYPYVQCLACRGIISGYPCGNPGEPCDPNNNPYFRPGNNVSRGQLSKIVSNAAGFSDAQPDQLFEDVPVGSTFHDFIGRLATRGYISGYPCGGVGEPCGPSNLPYFRPNSNATRGQISKIVSNAAGFTDPPGPQLFEDVALGSTFYDYIQRLASRGSINGYPCGGTGEPCGVGNLPYFRPNSNATRGQTSKIVANTFFPGCQTLANR